MKADVKVLGYVWSRTLFVALLVAAMGVALLNFAGVSRAAGEKVGVVVVGHGLAARDFPREKLLEMRRLHAQITEAGGEKKAPSELVERLHALEREGRQWKRTPENDPYDASVKALAARMKELGGYDIVEVCHNETCGLDVDEAIDSVIKKGAGRVVVLSVMVIKGGTHAEYDIFGKVEKAKREHPNVRITYAWLFDAEQLARLFVEQVNRYQRIAEK